MRHMPKERLMETSKRKICAITLLTGVALFVTPAFAQVGGGLAGGVGGTVGALAVRPVE